MVRIAYLDQHDHLGEWYGALPAGTLAARPVPGRLDAKVDALRLVGDAEFVHVTYPEHIVSSRDGDVPFDDSLAGWDERLKISLRFLQALQGAKIKIVWTVANRRPHLWWESHGSWGAA